MLVLAAALSVVMGVVLGLLGGGGSILTVPILLYVAGLPPKQAIATSLLVVGVTSVSGIARHHRLGSVRWRLGLSFGAVAMVGAYLGGRAGAYVPGGVLLSLFALLMVVSAVGMLRGRKGCESTTQKSNPALWKLALLGLSVGLLTGLVGAGGGFIIVPALVFVAGLSMREAVGTSLLIIALNSGAGVAGQLGHVDIALGTALVVTAAAVVGSFVGVSFSERISPTTLRRAFGALVLVMAGYILLRQAPASMQTWLSRVDHIAYALVALLAVTGAALLMHRLRRAKATEAPQWW